MEIAEVQIVEMAVILLVGILGYIFRETIKIKSDLSVLRTKVEMKNSLLQETRDNVRSIYREIEQIKICLEGLKRHE